MEPAAFRTSLLAACRLQHSQLRSLPLSAVALLILASASAAGIDVVVVSGTPSPDGNGTIDLGATPSINDAGQIAFASGLRDAVGGALEVGLFRRDPSGLSLITRTGHSLVGRTVTGFFPASANIDSSGTVSGVATFSSPFGTQHFFGDGGPLTPMYEPGSSSPSGNNTLLGVTTAALNDAGVAAYIAAYFGANPEVGIYSRAVDGTVTTRLVRNTSAPRGGTITGLGTRVTINESAQIAAMLDIDGSTLDSLVRIDGATVHELARQGDAAEDGVTTINQFSTNRSIVLSPIPIINDAGQVAFSAQYSSGARVGAFVADDSGIQLVVPGTLPEGAADAVNVIGISGSGQVAAAVDFFGGIDPLSGIYLGDAIGQTPVAIENAATPVPGKFFHRFYHDAAVLNDAGQLAFLAELSDTVNGPIAGRGLFFYDPVSGLQQIARSGDSLAGGTINDIYFTGTMVNVSTQSPDTSRTGMNSAGQVAFLFDLANGQLGIGVWSTDTSGLTGDYNGDGTVDAADYVVWRKTVDQTGENLAADGDHSGAVDAADYNLWRANFGKMVAISSSSAAFSLSGAGPFDATTIEFTVAPEPTTYGTICCAALIVLLSPRRLPRRSSKSGRGA